MSSSVILVQQLITGKAPPKIQRYYIGSLIFAYLVIVLISSLLFPDTYSMLKHHISALGGIANNPDGYLVYNIGIIIIGIAMIPYIRFIYYSFHEYLGGWRYLAIHTGVIGCIAFSGLGFIPEDSGLPHMICAVIAFVGFIISALIIYFSSIKDISKQHSFLSVFLFSILSIYILLSTLLMIIFPGIGPLVSYPLIDPALLNFSPYEWMLMISLLTWLGGMYFVIHHFSKKKVFNLIFSKLEKNKSQNE